METIYCKIADGLVVDRVVFGSGGMPDDWPDRNAFVADEEAQVGWAYDGETFTAPAEPLPPAATHGDLSAERDRRLAAGFDYDFGDNRGVHHIGTSQADMIGWNEVTTWATADQARGTGGTLTIATDTGPAQVTAMEWFAILEAATTFRQPIWGASFMLAAQDPIPATYREDQWWEET